MSVHHLQLRHYRTRIAVRLANGELWATGRVGRDTAHFTTVANEPDFGYRPTDEGYRCYAADTDLGDFRQGPVTGAERARVVVTTPGVRLHSVVPDVGGGAVRRILSGPVLWGFDLLDAEGSPRLSARRQRGVVHLTTGLDRRLGVSVTTALLARHV